MLLSERRLSPDNRYDVKSHRQVNGILFQVRIVEENDISYFP